MQFNFRTVSNFEIQRTRTQRHALRSKGLSEHPLVHSKLIIHNLKYFRYYKCRKRFQKNLNDKMVGIFNFKETVIWMHYNLAIF